MRYIPILNSSLQSLANGEFDAYSKSFNDLTLKVGVVTKKYDTDDDNTVSEAYPEYDVLAISQEKDMGTASVIYKKCQTMQTFGGLGDFFEYKLRSPDKDPLKPKEGSDPREENGSIVLLLCLHGNQDTGIILGALQHPKRNTTLTPDSGHHMEGEFNGINWQVNKDGALTISFRSATDNDGEGQDAKAAGTQIRIEKDGSVELDDGSGQSVRVEKTEKKVQVRAEDNIEMSSGAEIKVVALKDINAQCDNLLASCEGKAAFTIGSQFNVEAKSQVQIKSPMVKIQGDNLVKVESALINLNAATVLVGGPGAPALILTTQFMGIGNLGAPVMSIAIGPFSSKVSISS